MGVVPNVKLHKHAFKAAEAPSGIIGAFVPSSALPTQKEPGEMCRQHGGTPPPWMGSFSF